MGSRMSGKMAAATRVVQAVRPHTPLIKFPNRQSVPRPNAQEALKMAVANHPEMSAGTHSLRPSAASEPRPPGPQSRLPGTPDSAATVRDFPRRYRRRPLAVEEMDYIQVSAADAQARERGDGCSFFRKNSGLELYIRTEWLLFSVAEQNAGYCIGPCVYSLPFFKTLM
ncbi:28S ribosomal protein S36, mitochondrial isoform X1 [Arapaima gigas]